jgi:outer membrane lipoprotein carrier protein
MKTLFITLFFSSMLFCDALSLPENFKANFTQKITNTKDKTINYSGQVYFSSKTSLKWAYSVPTKKEVCTNGYDLMVVDHDLEQVSEYTMDKEFNLVKLVKQAKLHSKNIYVSKFDEKTVTIQVDRKQQLHSIAYFDDLENKVQITFKKVHYGKGDLSEKNISCHIPKEYDIIRG